MPLSHALPTPRRTRRLGAALCSLGVLAAAGTVLLGTTASADIIVPVTTSYTPDSSSTLGGGYLQIEGENLYNVNTAYFGDVQTGIEYVSGDGTFVVLDIPAHEEGVVDVTLYLDEDTSIFVGETVVTTQSPYSSVVSTDLTTTYAVESTGPSTTVTSSVTTIIPTVTTVVGTTDVEVTESVFDSYDAAAAEEEGIPFVVGPFTYSDDFTVTPDQGPIAGGTNVTIDGDILEGVLWNYCGFGIGFPFPGGPTLADVQLPLFDVEVYFGDELGTDSRLVIDGNLEDELTLELRTTTPEHVEGLVDVTVVFPDAICPPVLERSSDISIAALPPFGDNDLVFTRADGYEYLPDAAPTTVTESAVVTETAVVTATVTEESTAVVTTDDDTSVVDPSETDDSTSSGSTSSVDPTSAATVTSPGLSATGVSSTTAPMLLAAFGLLAAGALVMAYGTRRVRQH